MQVLIKKLNTTCNKDQIRALFVYPKVVLFEDLKNIEVIDLNDKDASNKIYSFEYEINHHALVGNNVWLALKSSEVIVINILKGALLKIKCDNYANYKIREFETDGINIIFISESGERLLNPYTQEQLNGEFEKGTTETIVSLEKAPYRLQGTQNTYQNGLNMCTSNMTLLLKCPVTGLTETLCTNKDLEHMVPWGDSIVVSNRGQMWAIDSKSFNKAYDFENTESNYVPLGSHDNNFYYLLWDKEVLFFSTSLRNIEKQDEHSTDFMATPKISQEVLKSELKQLVQDVLSKTNEVCIQPQLLNLFNDIEDLSFLIGIAIKLCKHNVTYKSILSSIQKKVFLTNDDSIINSFLDIMIKVDLLEYIYFRGIMHYSDIDLFEKQVVELCQLFISKSDLDLASICWLKYSKINRITNCDDILKILHAIPINIKLGTLIVWLRNFIPSLLDENPFNIDLIAKWTTERIFSLEQSAFWPKIGLKYIEAIIDVLESSLKTIVIRPITIDDLDILKDHIKYIIELKEKFKINMLITEITSQSPTEVALIMLRRCYTEDLEIFLKESLTSYANRYQFDLDETIRSFIEMQTASSGGNVDAVRLEILLNAFHSPTNRLDCLLQVLKYLDVPWDTTVETIAKSAAALPYNDFTITESDKLLAQEINKEVNYAKLKVILKKYNFPINFNDYMLVIHKIINGPTINLDDLKTITYIMPAYTSYANVSYIDKCLRECETKAALEYFRTLSNRDKKLLIKSVENKYEHIVCGSRNNTIERNYLDFIKGSHYQQEIQIAAVEKLYHLKNSYGINAGLNDVYNEDYYEMKLNNLKRNDQTENSGHIRCIEYLLRSDLKLRDLIHQSSTNHKVQSIINQWITQKLKNKHNLEYPLSQLNHEENPSLILMSHSLLSDLTLNCPEEYLHLLIDILGILNAIKNTNIIMKNLTLTWKFNYVFLPMSSVSSLHELINFYSNCGTIDKFTNDLPNHCNGSDFIPLRIIAYSTLQEIVCNNISRECFYKLKEKIVKKLVNKIIASQDLDQVILTSLLLLINKPDIISDSMYFLELLRGQSETLSPAVIYYLTSPPIRHTLALENIIPGDSLSYPPQYILKSKFNINLAEIALPDCTEETWDVKVLLFYILKQYPNTSFERLVDLCRTLNVCLNDGLSLLLISLLTNWELKYKISKNDLGYREILLENDEKELISKCLTIWQNVENTEFLKDILNDFWRNGEVVIHGCVISINPYFYEVLLCIYTLLISSFSESRYLKEYLILNFLKEYQRRGTPKQYEFEHFSVKGLFPEIGHYRLPFHLFLRDDMWSNLKSEITLETYERWLPVVSILSLDSNIQTAKDMICSNAVKQTMTSRKQNSTNEVDVKDNDTWKLISSEEPLLRTAHKCVRHIANMEWAGACLFYVLQGCARGADQVAVAQLCYQFSQRWAAIQPDNRAVRQMERLHSTLSTRHALHKIDWACEELLRLASEPTQLIHALYLHPKFVSKIGRHDINRAANEIADKNGININSIRIQILENLIDRKDKNSPSLNTVELITAKYILKATCAKMGAIYLSRIAFDDENDYNKSKKLRALQCFMSVVDQETAVKVTNIDHEKLWPTLLELLYIVYLERIDMPWIVATFKQDKMMALNQLLQASGGSVEALKVSAELAHRFGNQKILCDYIPLLLRSSLFDEIIPLLLKMACPLDNVICTAWRAILLNPFKRADYPITDKQKNKCLQALNLLPLCPFIKDEDLVEIWKNCMRCKCLALGCLVLPYMKSETRETLKELTKIDKRNLIIGLKNLHSESFLVSSAMCVLENVTRKICR
ncbi:unnamed protein product [Colias eurytheme]|nr:unnamed protein product [Colias eurytheme]